jgi:flagellar hook-associated protein 3 FlgL
VRVTDKMIFEGANRRSGRAREELEAATREASTGLRVHRPWDDPGAAAQIIGHRASADRAEAIRSNAERATSELNAADGALDGMNIVLDQAKQLALQFANSTYSPEERAHAASVVDGLIAQAITLGNARHGGRYLFGGFKENAPPFDATGAYAGDDGVRRVEVAPGQFEPASVEGNSIFKGANGGTDIFAGLNALKAALTGNDNAGLQTSIANMEQGIDQVIAGRARIGTGVNVFEMAQAAAEVARDSDKEQVANRSEADVISSATRLAYAQRALDAALTASAKSFELTLMSKLGR